MSVLAPQSIIKGLEKCRGCRETGIELEMQQKEWNDGKMRGGSATERERKSSCRREVKKRRNPGYGERPVRFP